MASSEVISDEFFVQFWKDDAGHDFWKNYLFINHFKPEEFWTNSFAFMEPCLFHLAETFYCAGAGVRKNFLNYFLHKNSLKLNRAHSFVRDVVWSFQIYLKSSGVVWIYKTSLWAKYLHFSKIETQSLNV